MIKRLIGLTLGLMACLAAPAMAAPACTHPTTLTNGLVPRTGNSLMLGGAVHKFGMNNADSWTTQVPDALCWAPEYIRLTLHDTVNDRGQNDPAFKRRAEIGSADNFHNDLDHWVAFDFRVHVDGLNKSLGNTLIQIHWPSGASPAASARVVACGVAACLRITTKNDSTGNVTRGQGALSLDVPHKFVMHFKLAQAGIVEAWLDGKLIARFVGPVGSVKEDGYSFRFGPYGAPLNGMRIVEEFTNVSPFPATTNLSGLITAPAPAF